MKGMINWMAGNHVAANILMMILIFGGLIIGRTIKQEVFPEFELDMISISVFYPGASPTDVEDGIIRPIEQAVSSVNNVKRVVCTATEGVGTAIVEIVEGSNVDNVLDEIKSEVDRILIFPENAEEPIVSKLSNRREVITLVVYGDVSERALTEQVERVRDDLLDLPDITQATVEAVRPQEISIEIDEANLQRYSLTLNKVADIVRKASLDMPGGSIKTRGGEVLIRTNQKRYTGGEFDSIAVIRLPAGQRVLLGDIATINDGFAEADHEALFDGMPAAIVKVYRVGNQKPKDIAKTVRAYVDNLRYQLPSSLNIEIWEDWSIILQQRMDLLIRNGILGFILVLMVLALFLEIRLALWVAMGAMISFIGAMLFLPMFDVSINMLSLFAFLLVIGVVVDDAIIVGENIHVHRRNGVSFHKASVEGTIEVSRAVVFAILTTIAAFSPLLFVTGTMGKFMSVIPTIVITVLALSLIESLFILPAHLSGGLMKSRANIWIQIEKFRSRFDKVVQWSIDNTYDGTLKWVARNRYITMAIATAILLITVGFVSGGFIKFVFMPSVDSDWINVKLTMAPGTPYEETLEVTKFIQRQGKELVAEYDLERGDGQSEVKHIFSIIGSQLADRGPHGGSVQMASNLAEIAMLFVSSDERTINLRQLSSEWRQKIGSIPNVEKLTFQSDMMRQANDIDIQLAHEDYSVLLAAAGRVKEYLSEYAGVDEVNDSYSEGKRELKLRIKPEAVSLGISETDLATQVRAAFYGAEAQRLQRGRNEIKVMVRYPVQDRRKLSSIENMTLRTPTGMEIPFQHAAYVEESRGYSVINRTDRKRVIDVTAKVNNRITNTDDILAEMTENVLEQLVREYPGLSCNLEGEAREQSESMGSLRKGFLIALLLIYALLALPFRSFMQPFIVMSAIPFGIVGAVIGHALLGFNLSLISSFGIVALTGVVVNDSLVMIDFINRARESGISIREAVLFAGKRRFRPIILTSLTTFFGLTPMILETSIQARWMVPMAVSLGFGVLFATGITLVLIPALYLILEDVKGIFMPNRVEQISEV